MFLLMSSSPWLPRFLRFPMYDFQLHASLMILSCRLNLSKCRTEWVRVQGRRSAISFLKRLDVHFENQNGVIKISSQVILIKSKRTSTKHEITTLR